MDYIYGKLNKEVEKIAYKGGTTSSAQVNIDHQTNTIYVDTQSSILDDHLNKDSDNGVQNKVVTVKFNKLEHEIQSLNSTLVNKLLIYNNRLDTVDSNISTVSTNFARVSTETANQLADIVASISKNSLAIQDLKECSANNAIEGLVERNSLSIGVLTDTLQKSVTNLSREDASIRNRIAEVSNALQQETNVRILTMLEVTNNLTALRRDITALTEDVDDIDLSMVEQINNVQQSLVRRIDALENALNTAATDYAEIEARLQAHIQEVSEKNDQLASDIEDLSKQNYSELSDKIEELQNVIGEIDLTERGPVVNQIDELHGHLTILHTQIEDTVRVEVDKIKNDGLYVVRTRAPENTQFAYGAKSGCYWYTPEGMAAKEGLNTANYALIAWDELAENELLIVFPHEGSEGNLARQFGLDCRALVGQPMNIIGAEQDELTRTLIIGGRRYVAEAGKWLYNTAVTTSTAARYAVLIYDKNFEGEFTTNGFGVALVLDSNSNVSKIYDGAHDGVDIQLDVTAQPKENSIVFRNNKGNISLGEDSKFEAEDAVHRSFVERTIRNSCGELEESLLDTLALRFSLIDGGTAADL